jgi:nicotinate phosphoribosyltransferase
VRDVSVPPLGDAMLDLGVTPRLVFNVRSALDHAWEAWDLPGAWRERARDFCRHVRIVVSGGFTPDKIARFEQLGVPADIYAVGSWLFNNSDRAGTVTDFTADVVRIKVHGEWTDMVKVGRKRSDNPDLQRIG